MRQMVQVNPELVPDRLVQALQFVESGDRGWLCLNPELGSSRVARQQVEHDEHDHRDKQQHHKGLREPLENVAGQADVPLAARSRGHDQAPGRKL